MSPRAALFGVTQEKLLIAAVLVAVAVVVCGSAEMIASEMSPHSDCCSLSRPADEPSYLLFVLVILAIVSVAGLEARFLSAHWSILQFCLRPVARPQLRLRC